PLSPSVPVPLVCVSSVPTRRSSDLVDGGAVADLGDGHAEQGSGAFQPVDDRFVHVRGGADDGDRGGFLQLADAPVLGEALCAGSDRKSTRLNSSHVKISYAVFCLSK